MVRRRERDEGLTLIEVVIAITLSVVLIGTMVAVLLTSMNAATSNAAEIHDSVDLTLVSSFLYKDAQAVGSMDPTLAADSTLGVSATDAAGCNATGLVARFKWADPTPAATTYYVVTYTVSGSSLNRFECKNGTLIDNQILGRNISSATLSCSPTCGRLPVSVSVRLVGSSAKSKLDVTLKAAVRTTTTATTSSGGQLLSLLALSDGTCPGVDLSSGQNTVTIIGEGIVSTASSCSTPVKSATGNSITPPVIQHGMSDPFAGLMAIPKAPDGESWGYQHWHDWWSLWDHHYDYGDTVCAGLTGTGSYGWWFFNNYWGNLWGNGAQGYTFHRVGEPDITYFPWPVQISKPTYFPPGDYVYCNGLDVQSSGSIEGSGLFFYVGTGNSCWTGSGGWGWGGWGFGYCGTHDGWGGHWGTYGSQSALNIDPGATINATAQTSGDYNGVLFWVASSKGVNIGLDSPISNLGGLLYAPQSVVTFASDPNTIASNIGGVVAKQVKFTDVGNMRLGVAPTDISLSPSTLPTAVAGQAYSADISAPGITETTFSAPDLPTGLTIDNNGTITGMAPSCDGTTSLGRVVAYDASGAVAGATYDGTYTSRYAGATGVTYQPLTILPSITVADPGDYVHGTVPLTATATNCLKSTRVAFQARTSPSGNWSTISGCTSVSSATTTFTCNWTPSSGSTYDIQAIATDVSLQNTSPPVIGISVDNSAPVIGTITPAAPFTFPGTSTNVAATVTDTGGSGMASVTFTLGSATCTDLVPTGTSYNCSLDVSGLTNGTYSLTVTAKDNAGNTATKTQSTYTVTNSNLTLGTIASPTKGTIAMTATATSSHPYTLAWAYQKNGGSWVNLASCTTTSCSVNSATGLAGDGSYLFRVTMTETSGQGATTYTATSGTVVTDNAVPVIGTITPATPFTFPGTSTAVGATVTDASPSSGVNVQFTLGSATCSDNSPTGNVYNCNLDVSGLANGTYTLTVTATDGAGNTATKTQSTYTVTNSSLTVIGQPATVSGTINLTATPVSSHPYTLAWAYSQNGGSTWTTIAGCTTSTCSFNTTTVTDNTSTIFKVTMTETSGQGATTYSDTTTTLIENFRGTDVAGVNKSPGGTAGKLEKSDSVTFNFSAALDTKSLLSGWTSTPGVTNAYGSTVYVKFADVSGTETATFYTNSSATTALPIGTINLNTTTANGYLANNNSSIVFQATMALSADGKTLTFTLGNTQSTSGSLTLSTATSKVAFTWAPPTNTLKSVDGILWAGTTVTQTNSTTDF